MEREKYFQQTVLEYTLKNESQPYFMSRDPGVRKMVSFQGR